jgi:hypothetical protein
VVCILKISIEVCDSHVSSGAVRVAPSKSDRQGMGQKKTCIGNVGEELSHLEDKEVGGRPEIVTMKS